MLLTFFKGLGTGAGLIIAIGAQNAFVLSQGVRKNHILTIALICSLCDMLLISIGVSGIGTLVAKNEQLRQIATIGGAVFLFWYGCRSFLSAWKGGSMETEEDSLKTLKGVIIATLAVTFLNPHIYLDTVVLMGSISSNFEGTGRYIFGAGAISASFIWFFSLSFGGRALAPLFEKPAAWRFLDTLIGLIMWAIALSLVLS